MVGAKVQTTQGYMWNVESCVSSRGLGAHHHPPATAKATAATLVCVYNIKRPYAEKYICRREGEGKREKREIERGEQRDQKAERVFPVEREREGKRERET